MDPLVLLLGCWGRDAVHHVVPFHHPSISLRLTRFDQLTAVVGNVELETVLERETDSVSDGDSGKPSMSSWLETYRLSRVFHLTDAEIFQRNDAAWFLVLLGKTYIHFKNCIVLKHNL